MMSDYKPVTINAATQSNNSITDMKNKVISNDVILNNILKYSKQTAFTTGLSLPELKSLLLPHYGIDNITDHHLLSVVLSKYDIILNNKIYEVNKRLDNLILDLLKPGALDTVVRDGHCYLDIYIFLNAILMEISLSRVDWLDYSKT